MNTYFVAHGSSITGPFAEEQLLNMWRSGAITADAHVCLDGTEEWIPIKRELNMIEVFRPKVSAEMRGASVLAAARSPAVSYRTAVLLSLLLPGLGHIYAGEVGSGIAVMLFCAFFGFTLLWPVALILYIASIFMLQSAVDKRNGL